MTMTRKFNLISKTVMVLAMCCAYTVATAQVSGTGILKDGSSTTFSYPNDILDCIIAGTGENTYEAIPPNTPGISYTYEWKAFGGISISGSTISKFVTVVSKDDETFGGKYTKWGRGRLRLLITAQIPEGCQACPVCTDREYNIYINKEFDDLHQKGNAIVGPACVFPGDSVTYSVAPWVNMSNPQNSGYDTIYWDIPFALLASPLYYSADYSSVTFVASDQIEGKTISVKLGKCNEQTQTPLTLTLNSAIPTPIIDPSSCVPVGVSEEPVTLTIVNDIPNVTYTWVSYNTWTLKDDDVYGITKKYTTAGNLAATFKIEADYINTQGCQTIFKFIDITRSFGATSKIVADKGTCFEAGEPVTFRIKDAPTPASFTWNYGALTGWSIAPNTPDKGDEITLIPETTAVSGEKLTVTVDGCDPSDPNNPYSTLEFDLIVKPGDANPVVNETTLDPDDFCVIKNQSYTFPTTQTAPAATSFFWNLGSAWNPSTWTGLTVTSTPTGNITDPVTVTPIGLDGCNGEPFVQPVGYLPSKPIIKSVSQDCINFGTKDTITYVVYDDPSENYVWDATPTEMVFDVWYEGTGDKIFNVITNGTAGTLTVKAKAVSTGGSVCSESEWSDEEEIEVSDKGFSLDYAGNFYAISNPNNESVDYKVWLLEYDPVEDVTKVVDNGAVIITGVWWVFTQPLLGNIDNSNINTLVLDAIYSNGCRVRMIKGRPISDFWDDFLRSGQKGEEEEIITTTLRVETEKEIGLAKIFPNPTKDIINIDITDYANLPVYIYVIDTKGTLVTNTVANSSSVQINSSSWAIGSYLVIVSYGQNITRQTIIKN